MGHPLLGMDVGVGTGEGVGGDKGMHSMGSMWWGGLRPSMDAGRGGVGMDRDVARPLGGRIHVEFAEDGGGSQEHLLYLRLGMDLAEVLVLQHTVLLILRPRLIQRLMAASVPSLLLCDAAAAAPYRSETAVVHELRVCE